MQDHEDASHPHFIREGALKVTKNFNNKTVEEDERRSFADIANTVYGVAYHKERNDNISKKKKKNKKQKTKVSKQSQNTKNVLESGK